MKLKRIKESKPIVKQNHVLLITGDGHNLPHDLRRFYEYNLAHDTLFIGRSVKLIKEKPLHYADVDAAEGKWVSENLQKSYPQKINGQLIRHTIGDVPWFDVGWDLTSDQVEGEDLRWYGSTALFAVMIGLEMGYKKIVLAGCPMDSKGHWYFPGLVGPTWTAADYQEWLEFAETHESEKVCSMSGYTKTILGDFIDVP